MSLGAMTAALKLEGLNPTRKLVLVALADHVDPEGVCYPSQELVAKRVGISARALRYNLEWLVEHDFLAVEHRLSTSNRFATNTYRLKFLRRKQASYGEKTSSQTTVGKGLPTERSDPSEAGFLRSEGSVLPTEEGPPSEGGFPRTVGSGLPTEEESPSEAGFRCRRKRASSGDSIVDFESPSEPSSSSGDGFRGRKPLPDEDVKIWIPISGTRPRTFNRFGAPIRDSEDFGTEYGITEPEVLELIESFPGVDVLAKLRALRQWARNNPRKRKTYTGMPAWLTDCMARAQNEGAGARRVEGAGALLGAGLGRRQQRLVTAEERAGFVAECLASARRRGWPEKIYRDAVREWFDCELEGVPDDKMRVIRLCTEERMEKFPLERLIEEAAKKRAGAPDA